MGCKLNLFEKQSFHNFWFDSGTQTFLVTLLQQRNYELEQLNSQYHFLRLCIIHRALLRYLQQPSPMLVTVVHKQSQAWGVLWHSGRKKK